MAVLIFHFSISVAWLHTAWSYTVWLKNKTSENSWLFLLHIHSE